MIQPRNRMSSTLPLPPREPDLPPLMLICSSPPGATVDEYVLAHVDAVLADVAFVVVRAGQMHGTPPAASASHATIAGSSAHCACSRKQVIASMTHRHSSCSSAARATHPT